jgi:signal recognition particle receptor subunit beta
MSIVNTRDKVITCKVVYYGPGLGGKTSSLKVVHRVLDPEERNKLISLKTDEERTLFFDFLPIELGVVGGYKIKIQGFTVPGQVKYNLTRKYVLMGADCVVFVADSQSSRLEENIGSMLNLGDNLAANGLDLNTIPLVIQYNKQDLADLTPVEELEARLNLRGVPALPTSAATGQGVFDAFVVAAQTMLEAVVKRYLAGTNSQAVGEAAARYLQRLSARAAD